MGLLGNIAKRKTAQARKEKDSSLYKRRDRKLSEANKAGKVTRAQKKALKTVKNQKDSPRVAMRTPGPKGKMLQADSDWRLYRSRDAKLDKAIKHGGKVTQKQKDALKRVKKGK